MKSRSLQCLHEIITNHAQSGTELDSCLLLCDLISDEIVSDIDVVIPLDTWSSEILLQFNGTLIIVIDNIVMYVVSLIFQKVLGPDHLCNIIYSDNLGLILTLSVKFVLLWIGHRPLWFSMSRRHQCDPSYPCALQMLNQRTKLYFHTCLLTVLW